MGRFWQSGRRIGMQWFRMPDWGEQAMRGVKRNATWTLGSEKIARSYFDCMARNQR